MKTGNKKPHTTNSQRLTIRVGTPDETFKKLEERFAALDHEEEPEPLFELVLQHEDDLQRLLNQKRISLLQTIARENPSSIRETARLVNRDVRQVHENLTELERFNLLKFEQDGKAKRPTVWYDELEIIVPISGQPIPESPGTSTELSPDLVDESKLSNSPLVSPGTPTLQPDERDSEAPA